MINTKVVEKVSEALSMLATAGIETLMEGKLFMAVARDTVNKEPKNLMHYSKTLKMPMSSLSRVAFQLCERGLLRYEPHATDRRQKLVLADLTRM